ncbi:hypothetical protein [Heliophilum fasciatum]|uniref:Cell division GTPase FtsZ n=1 Tax=Heliophilum fasciatum TaxID=35700 RepID=A0A4R2RNJ4_9FIRM|nr:hypothetical protein [Heliophilum fasciatum]MCW2278252.1 cell division GTPase FtsZ [Heliophilum fasciatum]TCP63877.1 cell division GTPase FtsZ [Heliophilum fasciatum]
MTFRAEHPPAGFSPLQLADFAHPSSQIAISWAVIGLGAGGGKIADTFASIKNQNQQSFYPTLAINSYLGDLKALKHVPDDQRLNLIGYEAGCGQSPYKGYQALCDLRNKDRVWEKINSISTNAQAIWVTASLGGNTGTGGISELIGWAAYTQKPVGAILTLPRKGNLEELSNALDALAPIYNDLLGPEADRPLKSLIIVDNEKIYQDYLRDKQAHLVPEGIDWMTYANTKLAHTLHELNVLPTSASDVNFDPEDFRKVLFSSGSITFAKHLIRTVPTFSEQDLKEEVLRTVVDGGMLSRGFDDETGVIAGAVCLIIPEGSRVATVNSLEVISDELKAKFPGLRAGLQQGYTTWEQKNQMLVYTLMSLTALPERAQHLKEEHKALKAEQEALYARRASSRIEHRGGASAPRHVSTFTGFSASGPSTSPFAISPSSPTPLTPAAQPRNEPAWPAWKSPTSAEDEALEEQLTWPGRKSPAPSPLVNATTQQAKESLASLAPNNNGSFNDLLPKKQKQQHHKNKYPQ